MDGTESNSLTISPEVVDFLRESNNIENERDDDSLAQALFAWNYVIQEPKLTPSVILRTHKILMLHHLVGDKKGYFRKEPVFIGGHEAKPWFVIPELIAQWCKNTDELIMTKENKKSVKENHWLHVWGRIQDSHIGYEAIHPFVDGNGRTGRIFLNWQRVKLGLPIFIFKEEEKEEYYTWFI